MPAPDPLHAAHRGITNEYGRPISMWGWLDSNGVHLYATSPDSDMEHTWTLLEAFALHNLLGSVLAVVDDRCVSATGRGFRCTRRSLPGSPHCRVHRKTVPDVRESSR